MSKDPGTRSTIRSRADLGVSPTGNGEAATTAAPALPARKIAVLDRLPGETDIRLRWDVDTGWASLASAEPTDSGKPRFLGFAQLCAQSGELPTHMIEVLDALRTAGFTILTDQAEANGMRQTWIRHHPPAGSAASVTPTPPAGAR